MIRRWMIRGMAVGLLMLCVGAWGVSYWRQWHVTYVTNLAVYYNSGVNWGRLYFINSFPLSPGTPEGMTLEQWPASDWTIWDEQWVAEDSKFLGFSVARGLLFGDGFGASVPLWFPALLSAALLWVVWRKTRPKSVRKGFPIDAAAKPDAPRANP